MSAQFTSLHPYVSQRLLSLFETLAKKHARLEARILEQTQLTTLPSSDSIVLNTNISTTINVTINDTGRIADSSTVSTVTNEDLVRYINDDSMFYILCLFYILYLRKY